MVELWSADSPLGRARRVSSFSARDAYAPSVAADGTVVFKVQTYRTLLADVAGVRRRDAPADDVPVRDAVVPSDAAADRVHLRHLAPRDRRCEVSGHRAGDRRHRRRRQPPASREAARSDRAIRLRRSGDGVVAERQVDRVSHASRDVGRCLAAAGGRRAQPDKRITFLGRGAEVGWPRWSPDGKTVLLDGARKATAAR